MMILVRTALVRTRTMLANVVRGPTKSYGSSCADATHAGMKPKAAQDLSPESLSTPHEPSTWCAACSRSARRYGSPLYRCASGLAAESYRPAEKLCATTVKPPGYSTGGSLFWPPVRFAATISYDWKSSWQF